VTPLQPPDSAPGIGSQDRSSAARSDAALAIEAPDAAISADAVSPATFAMMQPVPVPVPVPTPAPGSAPRHTIPGHPEIALLPKSMEAQLLEYLRSPVTAPRTFTMNRLRYPPDSHEMNDEGQEQTYLLGLLLLAFPSATIEIHGHSDRLESETYAGPKPYFDYPLSKLRADCVYRRIIHQGVSADRMRIEGHAATRPITTDQTSEGRQQNRRVEIVVKPRS
jgi:outer membrane protein OmpA-like peptidoglycan-associated protein